MTGESGREPVRRVWSVRSRILTSTLLVAAIGMTVAGATAYFVQRDRVQESIDDRLASRIESARFVVTSLAADPDEPAFTGPADALEAVLARVIPSRYESSLGIVDGAATLIPGVDLDFYLQDDPPLIARIVEEVADGSVRIGTANSRFGYIRYIASPIEVDGTGESAIYVTAIDIEAELAEINDAFLTYMVVAIAALAAIGFVGWYVAGRLLSPIRRLREAASRITANELQERIPVDGRDDVSLLTATVNDMLDRLNLSITAQRQLLDDVRHELKTPITIVRGHLELLDTRNPDEVETTRALAIDELDRMAGLVDGIESLAETQRTTTIRRMTDIDELTADVFAKASVIPDHDWVLDQAASVSLPIDSARITQAWLQLVDNAAKYSPPGSRIEVGSTDHGSEVELWVADEGPGIPAGMEDRIFERFGRVDAGRGIHGSGLGLPIVKAIANSHGGRVSLSSTPQGSRFGLVIPLGGARTKVIPLDGAPTEVIEDTGQR